MSQVVLQQRVVSKVVVRSTSPGSRAVFLVETPSVRERRQLAELFETVAELAEVCQLSEGQIMAYCIQVRDDPALFSKIEALLKSQFCFTIVERSFSEVIYRLVESLCADSQSNLRPVPRCDICQTPEPFPTRVSILDERDREIMEATYCLRCAAQQADRSPRQFLADLLAADGREIAAVGRAELVQLPQGESRRRPDDDVQMYAVAS